MNLMRREFLIRVILTVGISAVLHNTNLTEQDVIDVSLGHRQITDEEIESVYNALTLVA